MERSLHRQLKELYASANGDRVEVAIGQFRVDAETADGRLIEIQSSPLGLLKHKLACLLPAHAMTVVKPIVLRRRVIRRETPDGPDLSARWSPKQGSTLEVFDELVGLARIFPDPNLRIELVGVSIDEIRVRQRGWKGSGVVDRVLRDHGTIVRLEQPDDLWQLIPHELPARFTTEELVTILERPIRFTQRVGYCLLHSGAAQVVGKVGNRRVYSRLDSNLIEAGSKLLAVR